MSAVDYGSEVREQQRLHRRADFLERAREADPIEYAAWLIGHLASGGTVTHYFNGWHDDFYVPLENDMHLPSLYGSDSINLIVPAGWAIDPSTEFHGRPGHSTIFYMDAFRVDGLIVPMYPHVRWLMGA